MWYGIISYNFANGIIKSLGEKMKIFSGIFFTKLFATIKPKNPPRGEGVTEGGRGWGLLVLCDGCKK